MGALHANIIPLHMKDLRILRFQHPQGFWNQSPVDTAGQLLVCGQEERGEGRGEGRMKGREEEEVLGWREEEGSSKMVI